MKKKKVKLIVSTTVRDKIYLIKVSQDGTQQLNFPGPISIVSTCRMSTCYIKKYGITNIDIRQVDTIEMCS